MIDIPQIKHSAHRCILDNEAPRMLAILRTVEERLYSPRASEYDEAHHVELRLAVRLCLADLAIIPNR